MNRQLIFVHGINNEDLSVTDIQSLWVGALRRGLGTPANSWWGSVNIRTAYYADVLDEAEKAWGISSATVTPMSVDSPDQDFAPDDVAALYLEMQHTRDITDAAVAARLDPSDTSMAAVRMGSGIHKRWLKAIARALEDIVPGAAQGMAELFLRQAAAYLFKPGLFDQINSLVQNQVFNSVGSFGQTVVVSHSLGTVVSYVVLRKMMEDHPLPMFVTLGSPLGIKIVKKRINQPYITPPPAKIWINGSDPEDFVALYPELNVDTFGPAQIKNHSKLDNGYNNPHDIAKYLEQPLIAQAIAGTLAP